ncbi:hypothetical protein H2203_003894 [Taxawa tesnikishii (nom. ined.)]|nr:hypothetical protein H2203_003894 [Dothideales sp. JES 119]
MAGYGYGDSMDPYARGNSAYHSAREYSDERAGRAAEREQLRGYGQDLSGYTGEFPNDSVQDNRFGMSSYSEYSRLLSARTNYGPSNHPSSASRSRGSEFPFSPDSYDVYHRRDANYSDVRRGPNRGLPLNSRDAGPPLHREASYSRERSISPLSRNCSNATYSRPVSPLSRSSTTRDYNRGRSRRLDSGYYESDPYLYRDSSMQREAHFSVRRPSGATWGTGAGRHRGARDTSPWRNGMRRF